MSILHKRTGLQPKASYFGLAAALMVGVTVLFMLCLVWLSKPSDTTPRLAELNEKAKLMHSIAKRKGDLKTYPTGTVCSQDLSDKDRIALTKILGDTSIKVLLLDLNEQDRLGEGARFERYHFSLKARGSYEQALTAIENLSRYQPKLFLTSLSLRNHVDEVELEIEGDFYCR